MGTPEEDDPARWLPAHERARTPLGTLGADLNHSRAFVSGPLETAAVLVPV